MNSNFLPRYAVLPTGTTTDASGAQTGANIVALAANARRIGLYIANNGANPMAVNFGAVAVIGGAGSIPVAAGTRLDMGLQALPSESVNIIGTLGDAYTVKEIA